MYIVTAGKNCILYIAISDISNNFCNQLSYLDIAIRSYVSVSFVHVRPIFTKLCLCLCNLDVK